MCYNGNLENTYWFHGQECPNVWQKSSVFYFVLNHIIKQWHKPFNYSGLFVYHIQSLCIQHFCGQKSKMM